MQQSKFSNAEPRTPWQSCNSNAGCGEETLGSSYKDTSHIGLGPTLMYSFNLNPIFKGSVSTSSQPGGISTYILPPHTTKRRTTTNLKNNQNHQKIKLYGSLTTKQLKKKHSSRLVGGADTGSWGREDLWQGGSWLGGPTCACA